MKKARMTLRRGALAVLLVLVSLIVCAESSKSPADDTSETAAIYSATVEVRVGDVNADNGGATSRSLEASNPEYTTVKSSALYWTYTAVKDDGYSTTGQTGSETAGFLRKDLENQTAINMGGLILSGAL